MKSRCLMTITILAAGIAAGCSSHEDNVCEDIGDCAQGGTSSWISSCQSQAKALRSETVLIGCRAEFDAYFACADSAYSCHGATAEFPGCADDLTALDTCFTNATSKTSCTQLEGMETACSVLPPNAVTGAGTPVACTTARDCQAICYVTNVSNVCAPRVDEIEKLTACAATCPFSQ
jgi:hypothetical protein